MSARKLTNGYVAKLVKRAREHESTDPPRLKQDEMRLYSFYRPGLVAGTYSILASQTITSGSEHLVINNTSADRADHAFKPQEFEVVVPRFSLDPGIINSYYPPDGHQDEGRILPHIVLNDPHYPWEISAGTTTNMQGEIDYDTKNATYRSMVPWVALLVFDPTELQLTTVKEAAALSLPGITKETDLHQQNSDGSFSISVSDYFNKVNGSSRMNYAANKDYNEITKYSDKVNFIFPRKDLVQKLFTDPEVPDTENHKPGVEQYKYLAHVRNINTEGCPDASIEQEGLFSIVISGRTGALHDQILQDTQWTDLPTNLSQPRTQICHLVSIEHMDSTLEKWKHESAEKATDRVGMVSLFSWVYTTLPPDPVNFVTTMRSLTENQQMLRPDDSSISMLATMGDKTSASTVLAERMKRGYTLAGWRTQTGEQTSAFMRGPLVPLQVPHPPAPKTIPDCSTNSQDLQILDPETGLMDLSYSSAWQLGKLLAISDTTFSAALMRFRSVVRGASTSEVNMVQTGMTPRAEVLKSVKRTVYAIQTRTMQKEMSPAARLVTLASRDVVTNPKSPSDVAVFTGALKNAVDSNSGCADRQGKITAFNGFNIDAPNNSDWPIIHDWMAEKLFLGGIPPHYVIPEPSFAPLESLRFFYIDDFWLDCLIDGALSVANHLDDDDDIVRREIKRRFNSYLKTDLPEAEFKPQIPCYGFLIRSKLIKAMPDLKITVKWKEIDKRFPVARWTRWDDQTLMCLLDRYPEELESIELCQPQHQQRFALGSYIDSEKQSITFLPRQLYTNRPYIATTSNREMANAASWLDFSSRALRTTRLAKALNEELRIINNTAKPDDEQYDDQVPNSCELGLELNDPRYFFTIRPPAGVDPTSRPRDRQLFIRKELVRARAFASKVAIINRKMFDKNNVVPATQLAKGKAPSSNLSISPPHAQTLIQSLQLQHSTRMAVTRPAAAMAGTIKSIYDLKVFADYRSPPKRRVVGGNVKYPEGDYIATNNIYYFDLNFALRRFGDRPSQQRLIKIVIDIPIESKPGIASPKEPLLGQNYDGPGVRMLNNQFFVPFLQTDAVEPLLHVTLVPRSADMDSLNSKYRITCDDVKTLDLGFRLAEANISPPKKLEGVTMNGQLVKAARVQVRWTEWYEEGVTKPQSYDVLKMAPAQPDDAT